MNACSGDNFTSKKITPSVLLILLVCAEFLVLTPALSAEQNFEDWIQTIKRKALKKGIRQEILDQAFQNAKFSPQIVEFDRNQTPQNYPDYQSWINSFMHTKDNLVGFSRVEMGKQMLITHKNVLQKIFNRFGVPAEVIVALWGVESFYGHYQGTHNVISALSTLAYEGRRKNFFTNQLFYALKILNQGHATASNMQGSWAGAMGHCQFMPSNFFAYAIDFDHNGKRDIWTSIPDSLATIANYLRKAKWQKGKPIGHLVINKKHNRSRTVSLPFSNAPLLVRDKNYQTIIRWNRSSLFVAKIIYLSNELKQKS